jgi:hypothetical protein
LNQAVAAISKATAFSIFGPFRPTTDLSNASSYCVPTNQKVASSSLVVPAITFQRIGSAPERMAR